MKNRYNYKLPILFENEVIYYLMQRNEALENLNKMYEKSKEYGLKEAKSIYCIIQRINMGYYEIELIEDFAFEVFEALMIVESLNENQKKEIENITKIRRNKHYFKNYEENS